MLEGILSFITLIVVIGFSWGVAVLPDSEEHLYKEIKHFRLTEYLFDESIFHRNLRLREKLLIANELKPEDVAYLKDNDKQELEGVLRRTVGLDLKGRDLRHADFSKSLMPKVDFREINEIATKLDYANFQSAKLFEARMSKTQLKGANLIEAQLQGADLSQALLRGTGLFRANLTLSDITHANFGKITEGYIDKLLKRLSARIKNPELLKKIKYKFFSTANSHDSLAEALGKNILSKWSGEYEWEAFKESKGRLNFAKSESVYQNGLADFLIKRSCYDKWIVYGIIRYRLKNMQLKSSFARCLLSLKDKKNKSGIAVCPGLSAITNKDIEALKQMASETEPGGNIQATFKCEM